MLVFSIVISQLSYSEFPDMVNSGILRQVKHVLAIGISGSEQVDGQFNATMFPVWVLSKS